MANTKTKKSTKTRSTKATKQDAAKSAPGRKPLDDADLKFIQDTALPAAPAITPNKDVVGAFDETVRAGLKKPEVASFFGVRFNAEKIVKAAELSERATAIIAKLDHLKGNMEQVAAASNATLVEAASLLAKDWDDFAVMFPKRADELASIETWWNTAHPGRTGKGAATVTPSAVQSDDASKVKK